MRLPPSTREAQERSLVWRRTWAEMDFSLGDITECEFRRRWRELDVPERDIDEHIAEQRRRQEQA